MDVSGKEFVASFDALEATVVQLFESRRTQQLTPFLNRLLFRHASRLRIINMSAAERYIEMSSVSDEEEWTLSASRGYGEAATRARMWDGRMWALSAALASAWLGGESAGETRSAEEKE